MTYTKWKKIIGIYHIHWFIEETSTKTLASVLNELRREVDKQASKNRRDDIVGMLTDYRDGNVYEVFSYRWLSKYNQSFWNRISYDNVLLQELASRPKVISGDIIISSTIGVKLINVSNPDNKPFNVFTKIENYPNIKVLLTNESNTSFTLEVIDTNTFEENHLDCSITPVTVNYIVAFT